MDNETYNYKEKMLKLREELLAVERDRLAGRVGCTVEELDAYLDGVIEDAKSIALNNYSSLTKEQFDEEVEKDMAEKNLS